MYAPPRTTESYGLRAGVLGPVETLAQSVSAMAPSTSRFAHHSAGFRSGRQRHLVCLPACHCVHAAGGILRQPVRAALRVARFALQLHREHAAAGLWRRGRVGTAARLSRHRRIRRRRSALLRNRAFAAVFPLGTARRCHAGDRVRIAGFIAYRDVKLSAEVMLWIEACLRQPDSDRAGVVAGPYRAAVRHKPIPLKGTSLSALGPALVLSIFSFVGFESATTLGGEAREPLKTIPRAVLQCALLAGVFFMLCAYSEVLGFRGESGALSNSTSPAHLLARKAGVSPLGVAIDLRRFRQHVCLRAGLRNGFSPCADADGPRWIDARRFGTHQPASWNSRRRNHTFDSPDSFRGQHDGSAACHWLHNLRPVWFNGGLRLPHLLRACRAGASFCAQSAWAAFSLGRGCQLRYSRRNRFDSGIRSSVGTRRRSRADSLSLSWVHLCRADLVSIAAKESRNSLKICGKHGPLIF